VKYKMFLVLFEASINRIWSSRGALITKLTDRVMVCFSPTDKTMITNYQV
jgi:hypothetical protein